MIAANPKRAFRAKTKLSSVGAVASGYDAVETKGRRKAPQSTIRSEDGYLFGNNRTRLQFSAQDLRRNFAIARWAVSKHLDYVSTFSFSAMSGDEAFDDFLERKVEDWSRPYNFDEAGRHGLQEFIRMAEAARTVDGDIGIVKLRNGKVQAIESDRIRTPSNLYELGLDRTQVVEGVRISKSGKAEAYYVHRRQPGGMYEFERTVSSASMMQFAYWDRFDQVRGISPLASALNSFRDVYENFDYALAKAKVSQLFALSMYRSATDSAGMVEAVETAHGDGSGAEGGDGECDDRKRYDVDFGRGPILLDLEPGDRAEFLESRTPAAEFVAFTEKMIGVALKALDIPYSYYDEAHTNYSGARQAMLQYEQSAEIKRRSVRDLLNRLVVWRIMLWIESGEMILPRGMTMRDIRWAWIPAATPWIDPLKETDAELRQMGAGLDNPEDVCLRRSGKSVYDNIDKTARVMAYAKERGVPLSFVPTLVSAGGVPNE